MNRYQNISKTYINKKLVYTTSRYPEMPITSDDIYVYSVQGDRFDVLALQYYKNSSLWWVISIANTDQLPQNSLVIPEGLQIRIPAFYAGVVSAFNTINS
jgi:phage tail protein X